jgi:hypothetical protein
MANAQEACSCTIPWATGCLSGRSAGGGARRALAAHALPFALDHINLWLLRDEWTAATGWTVVDCGITNGHARAWEQVFARSCRACRCCG